VTLASLTTSVCTVSGLNITTVTEGTCDIRATQDGNGTVAPASPVEQIFQVVGQTYTLTFSGNTNDTGSAPSAVASATEWQVAAAGTLGKSGYTFGGWTDNSDGTGSTYQAGDFITLAANKTIYAKWVAASYTITYADGGSTGGSLPSNTTGSGSVTLALNTGTLVKTNYYFNGWTIAASNYAAGGNYTLSGNVTATARWSQYTITYANTGSDSGSAPSATNGYGTTALASNTGTLAKTGYYFDGWLIGATSVAAGGNFNITGDATATPVWSQYQVTYLTTGSTGGTAPAATAGNGSVTLASNTGNLVKTNYYFNGWSLGAAGSSYNLTGNVNATPVWAQYTVTYDGNGKTGGSVPSATQGYGTTALATNSGTLVKANYYFDGWLLGATSVAAGGNYNITGDVTATAVWSQYHVTYATTGSTGGSAPAATYGSGSVTLAGNTGNLVKSGYYFNGWSLGAAGSSYTLGSNVTATPVWAQYTIHYAGNGNTGGSTPADTLGYGDTTLAANSGTLEKTGYDFAGWTIGGVDYQAEGTYSLTGDVTATAKWTLSAYRITYTDNQATSGSVPGYTGGQGNVAVAGHGTLAYAHHYFAGWSIGGVLYQPTANYNLQANVTATAVWEQYNLSYGDDFATGGVNPSNTQGYGFTAVSGNDNGLSRTGYYFDGWDINGVHYAVGDLFDLQGNSHATPHWSHFTLTYNTNGASQTLSAVNGYGNTLTDDGLSLTKPDLVVGHTTTTYVFGGWQFNDQASSQVTGGGTYDLQSDVTATAIWNGVSTSSYTVTYDGNNADSGSVASDSGITVTVAGPGNLVKSGYTFGGWSWNNSTYNENDVFSFPSSNDVTFTAIWNPIVYTVSFDSGGATSGTTPADLTSTAGSSVNFPDRGDLLKTGYNFGGWDIAGVTHSEGEKGYVPAGNELATAIWTPIVYHFVYDGNGQDGGSVPAGFDGYGRVTLVGNTGGLTNGSKVFAGWLIGGIDHPAGAKIDLTAGDVTAYANWVDATYSLSYQDDGTADSGQAPATVDGYGLTELALDGNTLVRAGHHIDGWFVGPQYLPLGAAVDLSSGNLVATAHWAADTITITYHATDSDSGAAPSATSGDFGSTATLDTGTSFGRTGYTLSGWLIDGVLWNLADNTYVLDHNVIAEPVWDAVVYTLTFDCSDATSGTCPDPLLSTAGSQINLPDAGTAEKYGYLFSGWLINGVEHSAGENYVPSGNEVATPIWTAIVYTIYYQGNGNDGGSAPNPDDSVAFAGVNLATKGSLEKAGYTFGGWLIDGTIYAAGDNYVPLAGNVTATAVWNAIVRKITYLGNGNTGGSAPGQSTSTALSSITLPGKGNLAKTNYTFGGWLISGTTYQPGESLVPSGNVNATAVWNPIVYTITYLGNGSDGGSLPANGVSTAGSAVSLAAGTGFTKSGYTFAGWKIGNTTFQPGAQFTPGANVEAVAVWQVAGAKTITYSNSGATSGVVPGSTSGLGDVQLASNSGNLAKTGYTFGGWRINGVNYAAGATYNLQANVTATPVWNAIIYVVSFDGNGNDGGSVPGNISGYGRVVLATNSGSLTRYGYTFGGWNIAGTNYTAGGNYSLTTGSVVAKAVWTAIVYSISFTANGAAGSVPNNVNGFGNQQLPGQGNLSKTGYTFGGWLYNGVTYPAGSQFSLTSGNVSLQAVWTPIVYVLSYDGNGYDGGPLPATFSGYGRYVIPANSGAITRYGFTFGGWTIGATTYAAGAAYQLVNGNVTATAVWTPIVYNVTFGIGNGTGTTPSAISGFGTKQLPTNAGFSHYGFTFGGWSIGGATYSGGSNYSLTSGNVSATAIWNPIVYVLSFDDNNSTGGSTPFTRTGFGNITVPGNPGQLSKYGYTFGGWQINGSTYLTGSTFSMVDGDATATAIWTPIIYTLGYGSNDADGGSAPSGDSGFGSKTVAGQGTLSRVGYSFVGWRIGGNTYAPGSTYSLTSGNVVATPVWQKLVFILTYVAPDAASGSVPAYNGFGTVKLSDGSNLVRPGYTLSGWNINNVVYQLGTNYSLSSGNITASAVWAAVVYVITYANTNATGGVAPAPSSGYGPLVLPAGTLVRTGYQQTGWRINGQNYAIGATYPLTGGSFTATPAWVALQFVASFDGNGATGAAPASVTGFGTITLPGVGKLSLPGFGFAGWQINGINYEAGDSYALTGANVTAYAQWNPIVFSVTFTIPNATSGSAPEAISGWGDLQMPAATGFKRQGYDFAGWKVGNNVYQVGQSVSVRRNDVTAVATWQSQIIYKEFSGFAQGSPLVTADMKSQISAWIKANPGFTVAECLGYTMGPTVLPVDKQLATNRAQYTCAYVKDTFRSISASGKWGGNDLVVGDPVRRVRITLHN